MKIDKLNIDYLELENLERSILEDDIVTSIFDFVDTILFTDICNIKTNTFGSDKVGFLIMRSKCDNK